MHKSPNIYEIAKKANVSHMTVSRAFNNPELVNKITRKKIFEIANELNYRPSIIARSMRTNRTNAIGLILPTIINPFFPEIVKGVDDYSRKNSYNVILVNTDDDYKNEISSLEMFINRKIDGIILSVITGGQKDKEFLTKIIKRKIPVVLIDRFIPDINCSYVITDNFKAAYDATSYLIRLGHKKISVISSPQKIKIFQDRLKGYKKALKDNAIEYNENYIAEGEESVHGGYNSMKEVLAKNNNITAIFAMCDFMAFGVYKYCKENNIKIPDNLSVIGFDDIFTSALISPSLTTMAQQKYKIGYNAAKILINSIKKNEFPKKQIILQAPLIERDSCRSVHY
jgi:DNA-binding LacI/PurR family transcriptional regulator